MGMGYPSPSLIKSIQTGTKNGSGNVTITSVVVAKSVVHLNGAFDSLAGVTTASATLSNATTVAVNVTSTGGTDTTNFTVVEYL